MRLRGDEIDVGLDGVARGGEDAFAADGLLAREASGFDEAQPLFDAAGFGAIAVVIEDSDDYPTIEAETADFAYARLQRMSEDVPTGYDDSALDDFAAKAREWQKRGDAYIFMINGAKVRAPAAAIKRTVR